MSLPLISANILLSLFFRYGGNADICLPPRQPVRPHRGVTTVYWGLSDAWRECRAGYSNGRPFCCGGNSYVLREVEVEDFPRQPERRRRAAAEGVGTGYQGIRDHPVFGTQPDLGDRSQVRSVFAEHGNADQIPGLVQSGA